MHEQDSKSKNRKKESRPNKSRQQQMCTNVMGEQISTNAGVRMMVVVVVVVPTERGKGSRLTPPPGH